MSRSRSDSLRTALRELVQADAEEVVALARERARARAQELIEDAMVEELLDAVARLPGRRQQHEARADREQEEGRPSSDQVWWTYCVVSAADAESALPTFDGIEPGGAVQVVREGELAALASPVPAAEYNDKRLREHLEDLEWVERTARRHESLLEAALQQATIVPLRLCTIYRDLDGVRRLLREQATVLAQGLRRVDGSAEWGVKVFAGDPIRADLEVQEPGQAERQEASVERPGASYLLHRRREREQAGRASELRTVCAEAIHERVSRCAREAVTNTQQPRELHGREMAMILNGAYLVARDGEPALHETVAAVQTEWGPQGYVIELTGPWPAYNFVSDTAGMVVS